MKKLYILILLLVLFPFGVVQDKPVEEITATPEVTEAVEAVEEPRMTEPVKAAETVKPAETAEPVAPMVPIEPTETQPIPEPPVEEYPDVWTPPRL